MEIGKRDVWSVDEALLFDKDVTKKILDQVMTCNLQKEFRKCKLNKYHTRLRNRHTTFDGLRTGVPAHIQRKKRVVDFKATLLRWPSSALM